MLDFFFVLSVSDYYWQVLSTEKKGVNTGTAHMSFSRDVAIEHGAMSSRLKSIEICIIC